MREKTNSMRFLEGRKVPYDTYTFPQDIHSADGVAAFLGRPPSEVYKTLVVLRERGHPMLVMVAGDREVDLRLLARSLEEKSVHMATHRQAEEMTGLQVGGISALALLNRHFDVYIDRPALALEHLLVSAGKRGINLRLRVADLVRVTGARVVEATTTAHEVGGTSIPSPRGARSLAEGTGRGLG